MDLVSWDDYSIPNMMGKKVMFQTTNQLYTIYIAIRGWWWMVEHHPIETMIFIAERNVHTFVVKIIRPVLVHSTMALNCGFPGGSPIAGWFKKWKILQNPIYKWMIWEIRPTLERKPPEHLCFDPAAVLLRCPTPRGK